MGQYHLTLERLARLKRKHVGREVSLTLRRKKIGVRQVYRVLDLELFP